MLELRADGIGEVQIGTDSATVLAALTPILGEPTYDEIYDDDIAGPLRWVGWPQLGLGFGVFDKYRSDGVEHLFGYYVNEGGAVPMVTVEGLHIGSTLTEARSIYPDLAPMLPSYCAGFFEAQTGETRTVNGNDTWLVAEFGEVPTPDPWVGRDEDLPLPPGYDDTPITAFWAGLYWAPFC